MRPDLPGRLGRLVLRGLLAPLEALSVPLGLLALLVLIQLSLVLQEPQGLLDQLARQELQERIQTSLDPREALALLVLQELQALQVMLD